MDRRNFLTGSLKSKIKNPIPAPPPPSTGLNTYTGIFDEEEIIHLLKRTTFGAKKSDINYYKTKSLTQTINELLDTSNPLPSPPLKEYNPSSALTTPDTNILAGTTWVDDYNTDGTVTNLRRASLKKWWVGNLVNQNKNIVEKMTLFWHNHFATEFADVQNPNYLYRHHQLLRSNVLGNFKTLTRSVTVDPAMLIYLNGQLNIASAPDENHGRELLELFCCGKGPNSLYTEADVKATARVLTGWRNNATTFSSYFTSTRHDSTNKQFSAFFNNTLIVGKTGATAGDIELDSLLNMIFNVEEVSKYFCRKLYRWFVYYDIDASVETNVIEPLAALLRSSNYEIKPVLSKLLSSEHFFDLLSKGCQIKSPIDHVIGFFRETNIQFQPSTDYITNYGHFNYLSSWMSNMQQNIGDPPDVSGWKAYYQVPLFYEIWINSDTLPKRNQFTDTMLVSGYTFNSKKLIVDASELVKTLSNPSDPNILIEDIITIFLRLGLSSSAKNQMKKDILLGGQTSDYYWTNAWTQFITSPSDMANTNIVKTRLRDLFKYLMNLAEYQLC